MDFVKLTRLTIYTAEDVMYQDKPLYKGIIDEARRCKLAGGTVFKADFGFGTEIRGKEYGQIGFFTGMPNLPIIITIVDLKENLKRILSFLEKCGDKHFLAFTEDVNALVDGLYPQPCQRTEGSFLWTVVTIRICTREVTHDL
jgi:PII-like signaling protein